MSKRLEDEIAVSTFETGATFATAHTTMSIRHLPTGITVNGEMKGVGNRHKLRTELVEKLRVKVSKSSLHIKE